MKKLICVEHLGWALKEDRANAIEELLKLLEVKYNAVEAEELNGCPFVRVVLPDEPA